MRFVLGTIFVIRLLNIVALLRERLCKVKLHWFFGDNIFNGTDLEKLLQENMDPEGGILYGYHINDPNR